MEEYGLLERLLGEQWHMGRHRDGRPGADDDDAEEDKVPIALKEPKEVRSYLMQTPHDPEVTYSGHKGKGYEVQVAEMCEEGNAVQVITHVELTPSSGSDAGVTVGVIDTLRELAESMERLHGTGEARIDYRHIIGSLVRKPGAFPLSLQGANAPDSHVQACL